MQKNDAKFLMAAKTNDFINLSKLLIKSDKARAKGKMKGFIDIDVKSSDGTCAIHYAARNGNIEMMEELISRGALIDAVDKIGWRPLSYASAHRKIDAVKKLIEWGSKVNIVNEDNSPMHITSALGHKDIVKILMESGADIHSQNQRHQTPVDVACENNHYGVVNILLSGSSNQIEEFSKNSFKTATKRSLPSSKVKMSTLPIAMSSNNIASLSLRKSPSIIDNCMNLELYKKRDIGSQEEISTLDHHKTKTFRSNSAKKSESLNAIYVEDDERLHKQNVETIQKKDERKSDAEIVLPYPTKFSTSEVLKLKSPLLPFKNNWIKTQGYLNKDPSKINVLRTMSNDDRNFRNEFLKDNKNESICLKNVRNDYKSQRISDDLVRSSLILQPHYDLSSSVQTPKDLVLNNQNINRKPPTLKHQVKSLSDADRENERTSNSRQKKPHKRIVIENSLINSSNIPSTSHVEYAKTPCSSELINSTCVDNDDISCHKWIQSIGLTMIWDTLVKEGFDGFLALSLATDKELFILCNNRADHKNILRDQLNKLNLPSMDQLMFSSDIQQTLLQLGLEEYSSNFIQQGYFYTNHLPKTSEKLMNQLGIIKIGHRRILLECLTVQVQRESSEDTPIQQNRNVFNLPDKNQISTCSPVSSYYFLPENEKINKFNSIPRSNSNLVIRTNKIPPPIPPRSCSIYKENSSENINIDNALIESMCQENISPKKKNYCVSKDPAVDLTKLDDIMNMLTELGRELDFELKVKE